MRLCSVRLYVNSVACLIQFRMSRCIEVLELKTAEPTGFLISQPVCRHTLAYFETVGLTSEDDHALTQFLHIEV